MNLKVIIDFNDDKSYDVINYLVEYKKSHVLTVECLGLDIENNTNDFNKKGSDFQLQAYYGLYYANRMGISLEYTKRMFDANFVDNLNINDIKVIAASFKDIGFDPHDIIDALLDGDYHSIHVLFQKFHETNGVDTTPVCYMEDDEQNKMTTLESLMKCLNN